VAGRLARTRRRRLKGFAPRELGGGDLVSNGYNLDSGASCGPAATGDVTSTTGLVLGSLTFESNTWAHPLVSNSPAIDAGTCITSVTAIGQRGVTRPHGEGCDIGAYEVAVWEIFLPLVLRDA
jgi:hypothetical protein